MYNLSTNKIELKSLISTALGNLVPFLSTRATRPHLVFYTQLLKNNKFSVFLQLQKTFFCFFGRFYIFSPHVFLFFLSLFRSRLYFILTLFYYSFFFYTISHTFLSFSFILSFISLFPTI